MPAPEATTTPGLQFETAEATLIQLVSFVNSMPGSYGRPMVPNINDGTTPFYEAARQQTEIHSFNARLPSDTSLRITEEQAEPNEPQPRHAVTNQPFDWWDGNTAQPARGRARITTVPQPTEQSVQNRTEADWSNDEKSGRTNLRQTAISDRLQQHTAGFKDAYKRGLHRHETEGRARKTMRAALRIGFLATTAAATIVGIDELLNHLNH